jgi:hypothetical protein
MEYKKWVNRLSFFVPRTWWKSWGGEFIHTFECKKPQVLWSLAFQWSFSLLGSTVGPNLKVGRQGTCCWKWRLEGGVDSSLLGKGREPMLIGTPFLAIARAPPQWSGRTGGWLQMHRLSLRNNRRFKFKTARKLPIIIEKFIGIYPILVKEKPEDVNM